MNNTQIIAAYETILSITGQMLEAARRKDWVYLKALEEDCRAIMAALKAANAGPLGGDQQQRKVEIIHKVLADDAEIRNITQPWMVHLQDILKGIGCENNLNQACGPNGGS